MKRLALVPLVLFAFAPTLKTWGTVSISPIGGGSDDSAAIRAAYASAGAGGTVNFQAGTYSVHATQTGGACTAVLQINQAVSLAPIGAVKFVGLDGSGASKGCIFSVNTSNVSIANGEWEDTIAHEDAFITYGQDPRNPSGHGTGTWESQYLQFAGTHGIISNVTISGFWDHTLYQTSSYGFFIDNTITNLHFHHNWMQDICGGGCSNMTRALVYGTTYPGSANCDWSDRQGNVNPGHIDRHGECQWNGSGIEEFGGLNASSFSNNWIDWVGNDGTHFRWDGAIAQGVNAKNVVYYHNLTSRVARMANEHQSCAGAPCFFNGSVKYYPGDGPYVFQSNFDTTPCLATTTHWLGSVNNLFRNQSLWNNTQVFGNTSTASCNWTEFWYQSGFETAMSSGSSVIGNVTTGDEDTSGTFGQRYIQSFSTLGSESDQANITPVKYNILTGRNAYRANFNKSVCGNYSGWFDPENSLCPSYPKLVFTGNWIAQTPPFAGNTQTSNIAGSFDSTVVQTFPSGSTATGTWNFGVVSNFSVDRVSFYVDNAATPVVVQQLQDDSSTFASGDANGISATGDRRWKYHATFSVGPYADGTHTLRARAIDVSGIRKDYTTTFVKGSGSVLQPPAAPTGLAASSNSSTAVLLTWATSGTGITYNLYRGTSAGFTIGASNRIASGGNLSFTDTGLLAGTTYYYYLTAVNSAGESGTSAQVAATTQGSTPANPFDAGLLAGLNSDFEGGSLSPWLTYTNGTFASTGIDSGPSSLTAASFAQMTQGMSTIASYTFGTGGNVTNVTDLAVNFNPYGIAGTGVINSEWERYQPFSSAPNFVFTANTLDLTATIPSGGGLFSGGINSGQIWTKATYTPGMTGQNVYATEWVSKVPHGKGMWPAMWLYMINQQPFPPSNGDEIDNPEFFVSDVESTLDWTGYNHGPGNTDPNFYQIPGMTDQNIWHPGTDFANAYHAYQLVWTKTAAYRYVDGVLIKANNFTWTAGNPAQLGANLAVGTSSAGLGDQGLQPNSLSEFPAALSIKSLRVLGSQSDPTPSTAYAGNGSAKVCIGTVGNNTQLYVQPFSLPGGKQLTISYAAKDTSGSPFGTNLIQNTAPYASYGWQNYQQAGSTTWKQYSLTTQGPANAVTDARLSFILTGLQAGECFEIDNISITAATPLPAAPTGLSATTASANAINLAWTASATPGVTYNVYQNGVKVQSGLSATSYAASGLASATSYSFAVSSTNAMGESPKSTVATATTGALPTDPTGITATAKSTTEIDLAYTRCAGCTANIYRGSTAGFAVSAANLIATGVATDAYQDTTVLPATTYYYAVTDVNQYGESGSSARASAQTLSITTPPGFTGGYVNNGDFASGIPPWVLTQGSGAATITVDNTGACQVPAAKVTVTTAGTITLSQTVKPIPANQQATLSLFTLGASNIPVSFGSTLGGTNYGLAASQLPSTSTCKSQSVNWFTPNSAISNGVLTLDLSGFAAGTSVYLAQVMMTSIDGPAVDTTPLTVTPASASVQAGQSITFTLNRTATAAVPGGAVGTATNTDSLHVTYTAPASVAMQHTIAGCPVAPNDSVFNTRIDSLAVHSSSATWLAQIPGAAVLKIDPSLPHNVIDNKTPGSNQIFAYTTAYNGQTFQIGGEKRENGLYTLNGTTDHHRLSLNRQTCQIYETYQDGITRTDVPSASAASGWQYAGTGYALPTAAAGGGATDAAGLPLLPLLATASELQSGAIKHALRVTLENGYSSNRSPLWPASTNLSSAGGTGAGAGARFRLKSSFTLSGGVCNAYCQTIVTALKQYGMFLADLGTSGLIQVDADTTTDALALTAFSQISTAAIPFSQFDIVDESSLMQSATSSQVPLAAATGAVGALTITPSGVSAVTVPISLQGIGIHLSPKRLTVRANDPAVQLAGVVSGSADQVLTWALTSGPGSATTAGLYTPPSSASSATPAVVTATADADGTVTAQVLITVLPAGNIYIDSGASSTATDSNGHTWQYLPLPEAPDLTITADTTDPLGIWSSITDAFLAQTQIKTYGGDIAYGPFALPNGNYTLTLQFAQVGSTGTGCQATYSPLTYPAGNGAGPMNLEVNGTTEAYSFDLGRSVGYLCRTPSSVSLPAQVTNGLLSFQIRSTSTASLTDQWNPYLNSFSIVPDAGAAHWTIDTKQTATLQPGQSLQLNVVSWYAGTAQPTWSIVSGPGTISAGGLFQAPVSLLQTTPVLIRATDGTYTATVRLYVVGLDYPVLLAR